MHALSKTVRIYRKRLWVSHKAYMPKEKFNNCIDKAPVKKRAHYFYSVFTCVFLIFLK